MCFAHESAIRSLRLHVIKAVTLGVTISINFMFMVLNDIK